jgi:hypothetical protein
LSGGTREIVIFVMLCNIMAYALFWAQKTIKFIPIKPLAAMGSDAPESYAVHSRVP